MTEEKLPDQNPPPWIKGYKPKREWVGLTNEEIDQAANNAGFGHINIALEIEAKLKDKNNG